MGQFETEINLIVHQSICGSLRYAKLIGPLDDEESLKKYSCTLLEKYIEEQLVYFPNSSNVLDKWIVTAGDLFESVIINNEIPITDMPPACQTSLNNCMDEEVVKKWESMNGNLLHLKKWCDKNKNSSLGLVTRIKKQRRIHVVYTT